MAVERNKDGSVSIKNNNGATTIGKIVSVSVNRNEENFQHWVEECTKSVTANTHTLNETEQYFLQQCDALPLDANDRRMKTFQLNLIMNYFKDKLENQASEFSFDMTDEEIEKWHGKENAMRNEAMNSSPHNFGLNMRGYYLPHTERNKVYYEQVYIETQKWMKHTALKPNQLKMQDICFFFEETTEHCECSGGGNNIIQKLTIFKGVCQEDIEKRSPRFLSYISTLRDIGTLPDFIKEFE